MFLTMPSSVIGRWISGSCTPSRAWVTCWTVGEVMTSCYLRAGGGSGGRRRRLRTVATMGTVAAARASRLRLLPDDRAGGRVEDERPGPRREELEQPVEAARDRVVGAAAEALAAEPVVLDEADDRGGVGPLVADVVRLGPRRDHQHRQPLAVTAPVGVAAQRHRRRGADRGVGRGAGAVHD